MMLINFFPAIMIRTIYFDCKLFHMTVKVNNNKSFALHVLYFQGILANEFFTSSSAIP